MKPVFEKDPRPDKENYRSFSILHNVSKIYEKCLRKKVEEHFQALLSKYQRGFRKGYSIINFLFSVNKKWRKSFDKSGAFGALLTDLSKILGSIPHELLNTNFHCYGLDIPSLKLLHSYLTKRKQRMTLNGTYSSWSEIIFGIPQCYILGLLLFNIFLCHLFEFFPT